MSDVQIMGIEDEGEGEYEFLFKEDGEEKAGIADIDQLLRTYLKLKRKKAERQPLTEYELIIFRFLRHHIETID
jgi:type IV secretory pathway VirJ component